MKKYIIWLLTILMAVTFIGLLSMQIVYMRNMAKMRYEQFSEAVRQSLYAVSEKLAHDETRRFIEDGIDSLTTSPVYAQILGSPAPHIDGMRYTLTTTSGIEADLEIRGGSPDIRQMQSIGQTSSPVSYQGVNTTFKQRLSRREDMINNIILDIIAQSQMTPINERADSTTVRRYLQAELDTMGIKNIPFEFAVVNSAGVPVYHTAGFSAGNDDPENMFIQMLFPLDTSGNEYYLKVYFPTKKDFIYSSVSYMIPTFAFTLILLVIFVFTIITAFRQKKLTEMKNDFINNMTHEFKTPISSISLAAQMLNDQSVRKSPAMLQQISTVISDETKRLRFQVEKLLQMSMFENSKASLKLTEVDANSVIYNIVNTFKLKVEKYGGRLEANLDAMNALVEVDEMHFTNVIFNLMDNAVKYRREDEPLLLKVSTRDLSGERLEIVVEDNGIGISKDDQKKVFDKFFRVSTGNRHDVKGFGLGLAYVRKMILEMDGDISVESKLGHGTRFIIVLPLSEN